MDPQKTKRIMKVKGSMYLSPSPNIAIFRKISQIKKVVKHMVSAYNQKASIYQHR